MASPLDPAPPTGLLQSRLLALAGRPDDSFRVGTDLAAIADLAPQLIAEVDCASVTGWDEARHVTVAASSDLAARIDRAQYDDKAGPCLEALEAGCPAAVPDIAVTVTWPGYRDTATGLGLATSLSIPLFAGSGTTIAALHLYGRRTGTLSTLTGAVRAAYEPDTAGPWDHDALDPGARELAAGLFGAVALRTMIQRAITVLSAGEGSGRGYRILCDRAADAGASLTETAARVIEEQQPDAP